MASMLKRGRAAVNQQQINDFYGMFEESMQGVSPEKIWDYEETCMQDNPGTNKAIFARGVKYTEQVRDHTKTLISVMFCGLATGEMLTPFAVLPGPA